MQTQSKVRFYITQGDDQPVVRTIAVPARMVDPTAVVEQPVVAAPEQPQRKNVAGLVRSAVKRTAQFK